jgi:DNA repair photolyase
VRKDIFKETRKFLEEHAEFKGRTIFLGFSSDAFPYGKDSSATTRMIKLLKEFGCHVMFCTKGVISDEVIDLLDSGDSAGITITCGDAMASKYEANSLAPTKRIAQLKALHDKGIETWISIEPVLEPAFIYDMLNSDNMSFITRVKLGKLNHMNLSDLTGNANDYIDWHEYGNKAIAICKKKNIEYVVKAALKQYL